MRVCDLFAATVVLIDVAIFVDNVTVKQLAVAIIVGAVSFAWSAFATFFECLFAFRKFLTARNFGTAFVDDGTQRFATFSKL